MNKKLLASLTVASLAFGFSGLSAQSITFRIDKDFLLSSDGTVLNLETANTGRFNVTVYAGTVASVDALKTFVNTGFFADGLSDDAKLAFVQSMGTATIFNPDGWGTIGRTIGTGPVGGVNDWSQRRDNLTAMNIPVMLVTTQPLGDLTTSDSWGLVYANTVVPADGAVNIAFNAGTGTARWSLDYIVGTEGSLQMVAIPEPSTYAALFGIFALAGVMIRRRLRK